ncbi:MAG: arsenate reductase ArsC [Planctomycetota bacterium]|jgi:arsenate reductase
MSPKKRRVLFLCTGNACRSQMAEGWARHLLSDTVEPHSAGTEPHGVDPRAVLVMSEAGVDISSHRSKHFRELEGTEFDLVVTLCDSAAGACPVFPGGTRVLHHAFDDPARATGSDEEGLAEFRRVRDEIREFVRGLGDEFGGS